MSDPILFPQGAAPKRIVAGLLFAFGLFVHLLSSSYSEKQVSFKIGLGQLPVTILKSANPGGYWSIMAIYLAVAAVTAWKILSFVTTVPGALPA